MSRTAITSEGAIVFKSKNLPLAQAAAFARCIEANTRFTDVAICEAKAKDTLYAVQFRPSNPARQADLYQAEWDKNQQRADAEGADFIYFHNSDNPSVMFVFNPNSGETWEMFGGFCQCPHKLYRLTKAALQCKHELELDRRRREGISLDGSDKVTRQTAPTPTYADVVDGRVVRRSFQTGEVVECTADDRASLDTKVRANLSRDF